MIEQKFSKKPATQDIGKHTIARQRAKTRARHGQAIVEMSLVIIVLLFLTLGLIQYGLIANARVTMTNLAREGARFAAVHAFDTINTTSPLDDGIKTYVVDKVAKYTTLKDITKSGVLVTYPDTGGRKSGNAVNVTISYDLRRKFILPTNFPGLSGFGTTVTSTAVMVVE